MKSLSSLGFSLIFLASYFLVGCKPEYNNPNDPKNICGGIGIGDIGPRIGTTSPSASSLEVGGIEFVLSAQIQNCGLEDSDGWTGSISGVTGGTGISIPSFTVSAASRNSYSSSTSLGKYQIALSATSLNATINLSGPDGSRDLNFNFNTQTLIPAFVAETSSFAIGDGASPENGDELIDPGEQVSFKLSITNTSNTAITGVTANIVSSNTDLSISSGNNVTIGDLSAKGSATTSTITVIDVSSSSTRGESTTLTITLTDTHGNSWQKTITLQVSPDVPPPRTTQVLTLSSGETFAGFTADSSYWYLMIEEDIGDGVTYYRFYRKSPSDTTYTHVCSRLSTGTMRNLAVDSNYFYIGQNGSIRRLNKTTCANVDTISPTSLSGYSDDLNTSGNYNPFALSVDSGLMYYTRGSSPDFFASYNIGTTAVSAIATSQSLGIETFEPNYARIIASGGVLWAHYDRSSDNQLWKFNAGGAAQAWGNLPVSTYPDLNYVKAIAIVGGGKLLIASEKTTRIIKMHTADISSWSSGGDQSTTINTNEQTVSLPSNIFTGCGSGRQTTSNPGCMAISDIENLTLNSGASFAGFTADSSYWYLMIEEDIGDGVTYYRFYRKSPSDTTYTHVCSRLSTGTMRNLAVDSNYFYIGQNGSIRRLNKTTCANVDTISPTSLSGYSDDLNTSGNYNPFALSVDSGLMYYTRGSSPDFFASYNIGTTAVSAIATSQSLGIETFEPNYARIIASGGVLWAHYDRSSDNQLWKFNAGGAAQAWGNLPVSTYPDLNYVKAIATSDGTQMHLVTERTSGTVIIYTIDNTAFTDTSGQSGAQLVTGRSSSHSSVVSACSSGSSRTSSPGCMTFSSTNTLLGLAGGQSFRGLTAEASYLYLAVEEAAELWRIYRKAPAGSSWSEVCNITDANLKANLAVDSNYFYIGQSGSIRRLNKTTCANVDTISPTSLSGYSDDLNTSGNYNPFALSVDSGLMYYTRGSSPDFFASYNIGTTAVSAIATSQSLGIETFEPNYARIIASGGVLWAHYDRSSDNQLWKFNAGGAAQAWGNLPVSTYPDLSYVKALGMTNSNTIFFATEQTTGTVDIYEFDLTNF